MPAAEFIAMASDPKVLGNPLLKTQHFIGGTKWEKVSEDEIIGWHQLRVPHQKYTDETMTEVLVKGHAHSTNQHWYKKVDGEWKFAGLNPEIRWSEFDFDKVFEEGREELGEKNEEKVDEKVEQQVEPKVDEKVPEKVEIAEALPIVA
jgi:scytalone dehydratase